jgi:diguanylate cyclase (GGDEF)-like protein
LKQQPRKKKFDNKIVAVISITLVFISTLINFILKNGLQKSGLVNRFSGTIFNQVRTLLILGAVIYCFLVIYILQSEREKEKELENIAFYDIVTGISNSLKFEKDAKEILKKNTTAKYAIIVLDIDKFAIINDVCGYKAGDKLLCDIAHTLKDIIQDKGIFARETADSFVVMIQWKKENDIINFINEFINYTHNINCSSILEKPSFSFGIYKVEDRTMNVRRMIDGANLALETAKEKCVNNYTFFNQKIRDKILWNKEIEDEMINAINQNEFLVYLQPKYRLSDNTISSAEALVRWKSHKLGMLFPDEFIPIFEKDCFIVELDFYVLEHVCKQLRIWIDKGLKPVPVAVNMSRKHLGRKNFVKNIYEIIKKYNISPSLIELEITETAVYNNMKVLSDFVDEFHKLGFKLSMDDFGTGYSSLNTLKCLDINILKLDREFFMSSSLKEQKRSEIVIKNIISMAKELNVTTVAEGVEIKQQVDYLKKIGCDTVQGYYFAKPMTIDNFEKLAYSI